MSLILKLTTQTFNYLPCTFF